MTANILAALSAALICTVILWLIREMMMSPVKCGKNTRQYIVLQVCGHEAALENHLRSLVWLNETKTLRCDIIVHGAGLDDETRTVARIMAEDYDCIHFFEDGDMPQWIRNLNF